jgi:hypothetical protein
MSVSLNALRRFLHDSGCVEERVLRDPTSASIFVEFRCVRKSGRVCRAVLVVDRQIPYIADRVLKRLGRDLAPCLGLDWQTRIPDEDPFG